MAPRSDLQEILEVILGNPEEVHFQPPENIKMVYPSIVYTRDNIQTEYADNLPYKQTKRYQVTVIDRNPDSPFVDKVAALPMTRYSRKFTADGLHHDVFTIHF